MSHRPVVVALAAGASLLCSAAQPASGGDGWFESFADAQALATEEGKDLLVDFTGSDWCGWCIKLDEEVFSQEYFKTNASKNFVFVSLDFPRRKQLEPALEQQNDELLAKFGVEGFPTILLMDAGGRPYAQTGYQPGGAESYVAHLAELRKTKTARDAAFDAARELDGAARAAKLAAGLDQLPENLVVASYRGVIDEIITLDVDGAAGLKPRFEALARRGAARELDAALSARMAESDVDGALKLIDGFSDEHGSEGAELQDLLYKKVRVLASKQDKADWDAVRTTLDEIEKIDPNSQYGQWVQRVRPEIDEMARQAKDKDGGGGDAAKTNTKTTGGDGTGNGGVERGR